MYYINPTVCPTYVGMNRVRSASSLLREGMPHVCGDEPQVDDLTRSLLEYAPRMWG